MRIRVAEASDCSALARLNAEVQRLHAEAEPYIYQQPDDRFEAIVAARFCELVLNPDWTILVAEIGDQVAGYASLQVLRRGETAFHKAGTVLHIDNLGVQADYRKRGVGSALLERTLVLASSLLADWVTLHVRAANENARAFYARHGFQIMGYHMASSMQHDRD